MREKRVLMAWVKDVVSLLLRYIASDNMSNASPIIKRPTMRS